MNEPDGHRGQLDVLVPPRFLTPVDGGVTWHDDHPAAPVDAVWIAADGTGYANGTSEFRGLYRLDGPDAQWQRLTPPGDDATGPGGGPSYRLVARHDRRIVVESYLPTGVQVRYGLLASDDAGATWRTIDGPPTAYFSTGTIIGFVGEFLELVPNERIRYTDVFEDPNLPGTITVTVSLRACAVGTEVNIVQEGLPEVIPVEACYLGWQESLRNLARLVETEIPG